MPGDEPGFAIVSGELETGSAESTALAMPNADQVDFEPPRLSGKLFRPADFS